VQFTYGLPTAPYYDFTVQKRFDDLVVGTHGRGIWILDDLHPLQEMSAAVRAQPLHLFTLRDAYRFRLASSQAVSSVWGDNPTYGADVNFWLASVPSGKVLVQILDGSTVIRTLDVKKPIAGINRVWWNLRYDAITPADDYVPWHDAGFRGPLAIPGSYTIRVLANGHTVQGALVLRKDPRSPASIAALREQLAFLLRVRSDLAGLTTTIDGLRAAARRDPAKAASIDALLHEIYNPEVTQSEDALRFPEHVYGKLSFLASDVASADAAPTQSEYQVLALLEATARGYQARAKGLAALK
jgi:hypothetical protein